MGNEPASITHEPCIRCGQSICAVVSEEPPTSVPLFTGPSLSRSLYPRTMNPILRAARSLSALLLLLVSALAPATAQPQAQSVPGSSGGEATKPWLYRNSDV